MEDQNQNPEDQQMDPTETPGAPRRRLGRGLNALLGRGGDSDSDQQDDNPASEGQGVFVPAEQDQIDIDLIEPIPISPGRILPSIRSKNLKAVSASMVCCSLCLFDRLKGHTS